MDLGGIIRFYRNERKWTQAELGGRSKVDPAQIGRFERGVAEPEIMTLRNIADAFHLECSELLDDVPKSCRRAYIREECNAFLEELERVTGDTSCLVQHYKALVKSIIIKF